MIVVTFENGTDQKRLLQLFEVLLDNMSPEGSDGGIWCDIKRKHNHLLREYEYAKDVKFHFILNPRDEINQLKKKQSDFLDQIIRERKIYY